MGARKFSAILGIFLLICSVVGIFVVMYGTGSSSNSPSIRMEQTNIGRTSFGAKRQTASESRHYHVEQAETKTKEGNKVTNELERILSNEQRNQDLNSVVESRRVEKATTAKTNNDDANVENGVSEVKPKILQTNSFVHYDSKAKMDTKPGEVKVAEPALTSASPTSWNGFPNPSPSAWRPWVDAKMNLRAPPIRRISSPGELQKTQTMVTSSSHLDNKAFPNSHQPPVKYSSSINSGALAGPRHPSNLNPHDQGSFEGGPEPENSQEISDEDQYAVSDVELEGYEDEGSELQGIDVGQLFDLATDLYSTGANSSDLQGFLRIVNETVNKGNNSNLLSHLNDLYSRSDVMSSVNSNAVVGRNAYETSLTAFVFMSFGVFLLNQIHHFIGKENQIEGRSQRGRNFHENSLQEQDDSVSNLELLFEPPRINWTNGFTKLNLEGNESGFENSSSPSSSSSSSSSSNNLVNRGYINNMFRALLNLVNAYTKDSQVLECIWSLYCQDLDKTAGKHGLYGIAARINSIGLRLIMDQIPTELTLDVMLRSFLGWDGLPCIKMFPKCQLDHALLKLQTATSGIGLSP